MRFSTIVPAPSGTTSPPAASTPTPTAVPSSAPKTQPPSATSGSDTSATLPPGLGGSPFSSPNNPPEAQQGSKIAIVLGSTFTALAFAVIALFALNRYLRKRRRCHHPESEKGHLTPIGVGVWARCGQKAGSWGVMLRRKSERRVYEKQHDDAEAGAGGAGGPVMETITEVDASPPLGTRGNPAELEAASRRNTQRWSWMSRISDVVGGRRSTRTPISRPGTSSRDESRPSRPETSSIFVGRTSADWEAFTKERWPNGLTVPPQTYRSSSSNNNKRSSGMTRSLSKRPSPPSTSRSQALSVLQLQSNAAAAAPPSSSTNPKGHTRNKSSQFRLSERSDGTFGEMPRSPGFGFPPSPTSPVSPLSSRSSWR